MELRINELEALLERQICEKPKIEQKTEPIAEPLGEPVIEPSFVGCWTSGACANSMFSKFFNFNLKKN